MSFSYSELGVCACMTCVHLPTSAADTHTFLAELLALCAMARKLPMSLIPQL